MFTESEMVYSTLKPRRDPLARRCALQQKILYWCQQPYHIFLLRVTFSSQGRQSLLLLPKCQAALPAAPFHYHLASHFTYHQNHHLWAKTQSQLPAICQLPFPTLHSPVSLGAFCRGKAALTKAVFAAHTDSTCTAMAALTANLHWGEHPCQHGSSWAVQGHTTPRVGWWGKDHMDLSHSLAWR